MVHALEESWRVLVPGGQLLDLRPLSGDSLLEIISGERAIPAGALDYSAGLLDKRAADSAVAEVLKRGLFSKRQEVFFHFSFYWDTLEGMREYVEAMWDDFVQLPDPVLAQAERLVRESEPPVRIHIPELVRLMSYEKLPR